MEKLRSLKSLHNQNLKQWRIFHDKLLIDEAMVFFFGRHPGKQFIRGKPVRLEYKDWMLCNTSGYCYSFDTYCGKSNNPGKLMSMLLGSKIVLELLDVLTVRLDNKVFLNNFFTSY